MSCLNNILESIFDFLQYDLRTLFGPAANEISNRDLSESLVEQNKCVTEHSYGCRPKIYNGYDQEIAEEECWLDETESQNACCSKKQKQIQNCSKQMEDNCCETDIEIDNEDDFSTSEDDEDLDEPIQNDCNSKTTSSCCKKPKVVNICRQIYQKMHRKCAGASVTELNTIENKAQKLWDCMNKDISSCPNSLHAWSKLTTGEKLPFYWAALSGDVLSDDPFENFKRFYLSNIPQDKRCTKKTNEKLLIVWHSLVTKQKMPFVMEAFIGKIGGGKVNINDEHEIQHLMKCLNRNCS